MTTNKLLGYNPPLEDDECKELHIWLKLRDIPHTHIPNESRSSKKDAAIRGRKLKSMGVSTGYWDYDVYVPILDISGDIGGYELVKIEMKRARKNLSRVSEEQKEWGKIYEKAGIKCKICWGSSEAKKYIEDIYEMINQEKLSKKGIDF